MSTAISAFIDTLNAAWHGMDRLQSELEQQGLIDDWAQANWESIVEASLSSGAQPVHLVVYGNGADIHGASSRFSFPDDRVTHEVRCRPVTGDVVDHLSGVPLVDNPDGYGLDRFVSWDGQWYVEAPPFDCALVTMAGEQFVVPVALLNWLVVEASD